MTPTTTQGTPAALTLSALRTHGHEHGSIVFHHSHPPNWSLQ